EVDVVFVRPPALRPEHEQTCVDALSAQGIHVRPAGAGEVDGKMEDACAGDVQTANDTSGDRETDAVPSGPRRPASAAGGRATTDQRRGRPLSRRARRTHRV